MIITCQLLTGPRQNATSYMFRSEDFHHAKSSIEAVEIVLAIGSTGVTTSFYVEHGEWTRILPLLAGEAAPAQAPVLPDDVIDAYKNLGSLMDSPWSSSELVEAVFELRDAIANHLTKDDLR